MRKVGLLVLLVIAVAGGAAALHDPQERIGVRLSPCHAVLEAGATLPYMLEVKNHGSREQPVHVRLTESQNQFPPLLDTRLNISAEQSRSFPAVLTAPANPGSYQLTAIANTSQEFGGTHAELTVVPHVGPSPAMTLGACPQQSAHVFAPGEAGRLALEATLTGQDAIVRYQVMNPANVTVANGSVSLADNVTYGFDIPLEAPAPSVREQNYRVTLQVEPNQRLQLAFNVLVTWDADAAATVGDTPELLERADGPTLLALGFMGGGIAVLAATRIFTRTFAPMWFLAGLYSRFSREELLAQPLRAKIFEIVTEHPGITVQSLADEIGSYIGAVAYHLRILQRAGYITTRQEAAGRRVFPAGIRLPEASALTRTQEQIIEKLRQGPLSATQLAERLGTTRQGAHFHLKALERKGHVESAFSREGHLLYAPTSRGGIDGLD